MEQRPPAGPDQMAAGGLRLMGVKSFPCEMAGVLGVAVITGICSLPGMLFDDPLQLGSVHGDAMTAR